MSTAQTLHNARQLLDRVGWIQHSESDAQGVCLVGALLAGCKAATGFPYDGLAEPLCLQRQVIGSTDGDDWDGQPGRAYNELEEWNEEPGRAYGDIVAVLSAAEVAARRPVSRVSDDEDADRDASRSSEPALSEAAVSDSTTLLTRN